MDNPVQLPLPRGRNSIPSPRFLWIHGLLIVLCLAGVTASAETPLRNSFDTEEMRLMAEANLAYTGCLQNHAREHAASSPDVRVVAGNAAAACNSILEELDNTLTDRGVNPAFYMGAITRIKNRAIRRVLPLLMMEKSRPTP